MIDFSKVRVGDKVVLETIVDRVNSYKDSATFCYIKGFGWIPNSWVTAHLAKRVEIKKGDVVFRDYPDQRFEVKAVDEGLAWISDTGGSHSVVPVHHLTPVN